MDIDMRKAHCKHKAVAKLSNMLLMLASSCVKMRQTLTMRFLLRCHDCAIRMADRIWSTNIGGREIGFI
jgi:hypothetical protein